MFQRAVHVLMPPILLRVPGLDVLSGTMPSFIHHAESRDSPARAREAKGAPLSLRIRSGMP